MFVRETPQGGKLIHECYCTLPLSPKIALMTSCRRPLASYSSYLYIFFLLYLFYFFLSFLFLFSFGTRPFLPPLPLLLLCLVEAFFLLLPVSLQLLFPLFLFILC